MEDMVTDSALNEILRRSFHGRRVLITGHNGFVGSWLSLLLTEAGAQVTGISLAATPGGLSEALNLPEIVPSIVADVRDSGIVADVIAESSPEVVFHLAAQALVLESYRDPVSTFATNVMGTAHLLDSLRRHGGARACVVVTSDKCYATSPQPHLETDPLGGDDPYSASKAAAELVAQAFRESYFSAGPLALATTRAGNIVGGGDWADDRIVPDSVRAVRDGEPLVLRRPAAVRPWQHVLEAVAGYIRLGEALLHEPAMSADAWNFGPPDGSAVTVERLVMSMLGNWRSRGVIVKDPIVDAGYALPERSFLALDSGKAHELLNWRPLLDFDTTIDWTVEWYAQSIGPDFDARSATTAQISEYLDLDLAESMVARAIGADRREME